MPASPDSHHPNVCDVVAMPVTVSSSGKLKKLSLLKEGNLHADGSEQVLVEYTEAGRVSGYVDLSDMQLGNKIIIRQYLMVNGSYQKYAEETYENSQNIPIIYITPKETDKGLKVTLQQTAGFMRGYDYRFILEA